MEEDISGSARTKEETNGVDGKQESMEVEGKKSELKEEEEDGNSNGTILQSTSPSQSRKKSKSACLQLGISSEAGQQNSQASCVVRPKPSFHYHSIPSKISHPDTMEHEKQGLWAAVICGWSLTSWGKWYMGRIIIC